MVSWAGASLTLTTTQLSLDDVDDGTVVLGVLVTVERIGLDLGGQIVAICCRGRDRQSIPILDLPLPTPPPGGSEWITAYRRWLGRG